MKVLVVSRSFPPEINSISVLYDGLVRRLAARGHDVTVITRNPRLYLPETMLDYELSDPDGVRIKRLGTIGVPSGRIIFRIIEQGITSASFLLSSLFDKKFDVVALYSPPLPYTAAISGLKYLRRTPIVLNVQDLYPQTAIDLGLLNRKLPIAAARLLESHAYKRADRIIVHSEGNRDYIVNRGADANKMAVIPNWVDTKTIIPQPSSESFREKYGLGSKTVVSFAGVMGPAQGLDKVIQAAEQLKGREDIVFLLAGEGAYRSRLVEAIKSKNLTNVTLSPLLPQEQYRELLASSDIGLVTLSQLLKTPVVPGKLQSIMAAGRAIVASVPIESGVVQIVNDAQCGVIAEQSEPNSLADSISKLASDEPTRTRYGLAGRKYAEDNFSLEHCADQFIHQLELAANQ